jgi:hypothetical protein
MKCKTCGKNADSEFCFKCKPRKPLSSGKGLSKKSSKPQEKLDRSSEMKQFFMRYWRENKEHNCEICKVWLGSNPLTYMFDHVLEKSKYPELAFEEENIMYLCLLCHDKKTRGYYDDITKERINYLKTKYKL